MITLDEIEAFFFKAMLTGYAGGGQKTKVPDMPGYKEIMFLEGDFCLRDRYCVTPLSAKSAGTTTIWFKDVPVWVMNFGGYYDKTAITFLRDTLRDTYREQKFSGGRGPALSVSDEFVYVNRPYPNDFAKFEGRELIYRRRYSESGIDLCHREEDSLGYHEYWGMSLL